MLRISKGMKALPNRYEDRNEYRGMVREWKNFGWTSKIRAGQKTLRYEV